MRKFLYAAVAFSLVAPAVVSAPAFADDRTDRTYHRDRQDYRYRCKRSNHATGTVVGGVGGAVAGGAIIGGPIATIAGGVGGALLGRHIDKKEHEKRNRERGC